MNVEMGNDFKNVNNVYKKPRFMKIEREGKGRRRRKNNNTFRMWGGR